MKHDIQTRTHVELLVHEFYKKVQADSLLSPVFAHVNWPHHLPLMCDFWALTLLGEPGYRNNMVQKHLHLKLSPEHFTQWLSLFNATLDELFSGEKAEEAKSRAYSMAVVIQVKLGIA